MSSFAKLAALLAAVICSTTVAFAHTGVDDASGFHHGFAHPLLGLDHSLAMVMVGLYAYQLRGNATLLLPVTFVLSMAFGAMLGFVGIPLPFVELGIALSVFVIGAVVTFAFTAPPWLVAGLTTTFALLHGYANGVEAPGYVGGATYALGFLLATATLHMAGVAFGLLMEKVLYGRSIVQTSGGLAACAGAAMFTGIF